MYKERGGEVVRNLIDLNVACVSFRQTSPILVTDWLVVQCDFYPCVVELLSTSVRTDYETVTQSCADFLYI